MNQRDPVQCSNLRRRHGQALRTARLRLAVLGGVIGIACLTLSVRLVHLMVVAGPPGAHAAQEEPVDGRRRADIIDRHGHLLATSVPTYSIVANPQRVPNPARHAERLARALGHDSAAVFYKRLSGGGEFAYIKRQITPAEMRAVNALGIPGVNFRRAYRRIYPQGAAAAHVVGTVNRDGGGTAGIERAFDDSLSEAPDSALRLSLDMRLQQIVIEELQAGIKRFQAKGGGAVVLDLASGEVLASVSLPSFEPNVPGDAQSPARFNRVTKGVYELGSVFKLITAAAALESGAAQPFDAFDARHPIRIGRHIIRDFRPEKRWLSIPEIMVHSSNIGTAYMALAAGAETHRRFLMELGLTTALDIELPERQRPDLPQHWGKVHQATIGYGHGIAVSPLHMAAAIGSLLREQGRLHPSFVIRGDSHRRGGGMAAEPILSPKNRDMLRRMMRAVVAHSPVDGANPEGWLLGGKTGTAQKVDREKGGYGKGRIAAFAGAFPMTDPRYVLFAMIDAPVGQKESFGYATGGWVAAPVVGRIVARMGPLYGMAPLDAADPELAARLALPMEPRGYMVPVPDEPGQFVRTRDEGRAIRAAY